MERKISIGEADKLYLAGKITGDSEYRKKFGTAMEHLTRAGWKVMNPAMLPEGLDAVVFLEGWEKSRGAMLERLYCDYIGKPCYRFVTVAPGAMELQDCEDLTFGDAVRAMNDEELAEFLLKVEVGEDIPWGATFKKEFCDNCQPMKGIYEGKQITVYPCVIVDEGCPHGNSDILWWLQQPIQNMTAEVGESEAPCGTVF